jgi:crotonobetainyl-CoA:carnitine CoA-transferase CaiB-like acyl-CoA transferase
MSGRGSTTPPERNVSDSPDLPLSGMRVAELCHVASGPFAGMLLADLGADVVKIEGPSGDQMRAWPPIEHLPDGATFSHNFGSINRNKRSVVCDLKTVEGRDLAASLVSAADVLIENYRPGMLARFGLDFPTVSARRTGLVYCSISGFGQSGPLAQQGAYDVVVQAISGLMSVTGDPDGPPLKCGVPLADFVAGLYAAYMVSALYPISQATGRSFHVDCPMLDCLLGISALQTSEYWGTGREPQRFGSRHPRNAPYQVFPAADTMFALAAGNDRLWHEVCEVVGCPELADDPRFVNQTARAANQNDLEEILSSIFRRRTAAEWLDRFTRVGVPCGPVNTFGDILASEHVRAGELIEHVQIPHTGWVPIVAFPPRINGRRLRARRGAPSLGGDADAVRSEWT